MELTQREKILLAATAITIIVATVIVLSVLIRIPSVGRIKAVGVKFFWDEACTVEATEIDWGMLTPGGTYGVTLYCKNVKNTPVTLNLTTNNWNPPSASQYLYGDWNYTLGTVIQEGEVIPIQFQLSVSINISGIDQFSFDYVVGVTEHVE
jgi:hypothetical protein